MLSLVSKSITDLGKSTYPEKARGDKLCKILLETRVSNKSFFFLYLLWGDNTENISKYIGVPYVFYGEDFSGTNCIGLCRLFYRDHGWKQNFRDGKPITKDWMKKDRTRLIRYLRENFTETTDINELSFGDVLLFDFFDDYHMGIYLEYGDILSEQVPCVEHETTSTIYHRGVWLPYFRRGFKR